MSAAHVQIRPGRFADRPRLAALNRECWDPGNSPAPEPSAEWDAFERRTPDDYLVADQEGLVVGFIALGHPTPLPASRHVVEVQGLAVDASARRRGVARALLKAAIAETRRRGANKVSLRVMDTNPIARALYTDLGFEVEGHLVDEFIVQGSPVSDRLMALHLARDPHG